MRFALPAQFGGTTTVQGVQRVLIVLASPAEGLTPTAMHATLPFPSAATNFTTHYVGGAKDGVFGGRVPVVDEPRRTEMANEATLDLVIGTRGSASIYLEADSIVVTVAGSRGELLHNIRNELVNLVPPDASQPDLARAHAVPDHPTVRVLRQRDNASFSLHATGLHLAEWYNAQVDCPTRPCPSGGGPTSTGMTEAGIAAYTDTRSWEQLETSGGEVTARGGLPLLIFSGPSPEIATAGWFRLPFASGHTDCSTCLLPANQTLTASGELRLTDLHYTDSQWAAASFDGDLATAKFDEQAIKPELLGTIGASVAATGAVIVGSALAVKLLGLLFSRTLKDPLAHPRRARLHTYIQEHPGANFREVARATGIATGTARHHLTVLVRTKIVVERPHGSTLRFFENHGKFDISWTREVLLREPDLATLHAWIVAHPGSPQKDILNAMETQRRWSRSTTQHRLVRLAAGGLVDLRLQGRLKLYSADAGTAPVVQPRIGSTPPNIAVDGI